MKPAVFILGLMVAFAASDARPASAGVILVRLGDLHHWAFHATDRAGLLNSGVGIRPFVNELKFLPLVIHGTNPRAAMIEAIAFRQFDCGADPGTDLLSICYSDSLHAVTGSESLELRIPLLDNRSGTREVSSKRMFHRMGVGGAHDDSAWRVWNGWDRRKVQYSFTVKLQESNASTLAHFLKTNSNPSVLYRADQAFKDFQLSSGYRGRE